MNSKAPSLNFLLAEDDTVAAIDLECILEDLGHRVTAVAVSPGMALRELELHADRIDAVIYSDILVGMPSHSLAHVLSRDGRPSAVVSRRPEAIVRARGFQDPYLAKPFAVRDVGRLVRGFGTAGATAVA